MKRNGTTNGKNLPPMNREPPRILALGGMERFAQRVEINRRPSSFNGPSPSATLPTTPPFLQRLGINPGFLWGDYWNYYTPAKWNRTELSDVDRGGFRKGEGGGGVVSRFRRAIAFSVFPCVFLERWTTTTTMMKGGRVGERGVERKDENG